MCKLVVQKISGRSVDQWVGKGGGGVMGEVIRDPWFKLWRWGGRVWTP